MLFKKSLILILCLAMVIAAMAFTQTSKSGSAKTTTKVKSATVEYVYWFSYIGPTNASFEEYTDPDNYVLLPNDYDPYECGFGYDEVCSIVCERFWHSDAWRPDFTYNPGYASAYWGLNNFVNYGFTLTNFVVTKSL
jgi:hypothetical protein